MITRVLASTDSLIFETDAPGLSLTERVPVPDGRVLSRCEIKAENGKALLPRFDGSRDRLLSRFETDEGEVRFVQDFVPGASENDYPYPQPPCIKAMSCPYKDDIDRLGVHQALYNVNLPALMTLTPSKDTISYRFGGSEYYFRKDRVEEIDEFMISSHENGMLVTLILLNSPHMFASLNEKALLDKVIHPRYEKNARDAFLSAFDMVREEGQSFFGAFAEFLAERYSRADARYGRALGMIVSNEINSSCVWNNCGETDVTEMCEEYTRAMRIAWLLGRKHYASFRVYVSLDQFFNDSYRPAEPLHSYKGRDVLENIAANCLREGNFGWGVAYHPYPEDLNYPDFWNDRAPRFDFKTPKITFKNMEVLPAFLSRDEFLYEGTQRRIIFSEQGFNSQSGALKELTEKQAAAAYCLAYLKARNIPTLDLFTHHSYIDNPHEFGLNLGIRRYDADREDHRGEPKPIFGTVCDMDTERESERVRISRDFIGHELFDFLLHPSVDTDDAEDDTSVDFGN